MSTTVSSSEENLGDRINRLQRELDRAKNLQARCKHEFGKPVYAPRDVPEYVLNHYEGHGSDPEPIYDVFMKKEDAWERCCIICGYTQYTSKTKPIIKGYKADFGDEPQ